MIKASVDIGTNTVLMLIAENNEAGSLNILDDYQRAPRLGRDVDKNKVLSDEAVRRTMDVLQEYKTILSKNYPEIISPVVTATSAVRDAGNREKFINRVYNETGWKVRLLSGETEGKLTFQGALSVIELPDKKNNISVIDIGGGSTELILGKCNGIILKLKSLNMGCVRLTERFLNNKRTSRAKINQAGNEIRRYFEDIPYNREDIEFIVGVAGTAVALGAIKLGLKSYNADKLNGAVLKAGDIENFIFEFTQTSNEEAKSKYCPFLDGREDIILAGCLILYSYLNWADKQSLFVSTGGLRHGVLVSDVIEKLNF